MAVGIKDLFDRFDRDGSGGLDIVELQDGLRGLGITSLGRDQLKALRSELAGEGAAVVSFKPFVASLQKHAWAAAVAADSLAPAWAHPRIKDAEDIFLDLNEDGGGSGSIAATDLGARLQQGERPMPKAQAAALCDFLVESGLGRVTLAQFQVRDGLVLHV